MSNLKDQVTTLLSPELPLTLSNWNTLLNFFEKHKTELDMNEIELLASRSEKFRNHWNEDREIVQTVTKNGKQITLRTVKRGLGINKVSVTPNIQAYLEANRI